MPWPLLILGGRQLTHVLRVSAKQPAFPIAPFPCDSSSTKPQLEVKYVHPAPGDACAGFVGLFNLIITVSVLSIVPLIAAFLFLSGTGRAA